MSWISEQFDLGWIVARMGWHFVQDHSSLILTVFHLILFIVSQGILRRSKRLLQKEKAELTVEVTQLKGQLNYFKRNYGTK